MKRLSLLESTGAGRLQPGARCSEPSDSQLDSEERQDSPFLWDATMLLLKKMNVITREISDNKNGKTPQSMW